MPGHVLAANRFANRPFHQCHRPLPAVLDPGRPTQVGPIKLESRVNERPAEIAGRVQQHPGGQPALPHAQVFGIQEAVHGRQVLRLADHQLLNSWVVPGQPRQPGPAERRGPGQRVNGHQIIGSLWVPPGHSIHVGRGKLRLEGKDRRGPLPGVGLSRLRQQGNQQPEVFGPGLAELVLTIIRLIGHAKPRLVEVHHVTLRVACVVADIGQRQAGTPGAG